MRVEVILVEGKRKRTREVYVSLCDALILFRCLFLLTLNSFPFLRLEFSE